MRKKKKIKVSFNLVTTPSDGCDEDNDIVISAKVHGSKESSSLKPACQIGFWLQINQCKRDICAVEPSYP